MLVAILDMDNDIQESYNFNRDIDVPFVSRIKINCFVCCDSGLLYNS